MNSQQVNKNETIHTKVQFDGEIRRFVLPSTNFEDLTSTLRTLFGLSDVAFKVCFLDEEEDWITISTDDDLKYAVQITTSPLRLRVELAEVSTNVIGTTCTSEIGCTQDEFPVWKGGKGKRGKGCGGRGRGQGCQRGRGQGKCQNLSYEDRMNLKSERLNQRIQHLQSLSEGDNVTADRKRVLLWRLQKLQDKLEMVDATKLSADDCQFATHPHPHPHPPHGHQHPHGGPHHPQGCRGRGGRGRGGRQCHKPSDEVVGSQVWQCKQDLITARQSGNKEEITVALSALKKAKQLSKGERSPEKALLLTTKKEGVANARHALFAARDGGDKAEIKVCQQALQQAKSEFKQAKWESYTQ